MATLCHPQGQACQYRPELILSRRCDYLATQASWCILQSRCPASLVKKHCLGKAQANRSLSLSRIGALSCRRSLKLYADSSRATRSTLLRLSGKQGQRLYRKVQDSSSISIRTSAAAGANRDVFADGDDLDQARNDSGLGGEDSLHRTCPEDDMRRVPSRDQESKSTPPWKGWAMLRVIAKSLPLLCVGMLLSSLFTAKPAMALEMSSLRQSLNDRAREVAVRSWPSLKAVGMVIRDQGLLLVVLLALSAFFSMAETSITTLWPWKVRELAEKEKEGGVFSVLRQDVTRFLTTILIGTTVVNIGATALVTEAATTIFGEAGVTAATGIMTVLLLLVTEIAPKSIAVHNATEVARVVVRPVAWLSVVLYPVGRACTALSMWLLKLLGLKSSGDPNVSEEELKLMLRGAELSGAIEEEEQDMIENVLEIKDTFVAEVMTPLVNVVAIDAAATLLDLRQLWVKHQYSRVPVYERRVDNIVGISYAMDLLDYCEEPHILQQLTTGRIAHRPAYFVPDSMSVWNLLREFRIRKVHMAIVLNEYGGTIGLVTLEDVVEEIVGEIFDESDSKEEIRKKTGYMVQRGEGVYDVDANTSIEDLMETFEIDLPEGPYRYETVSGYVCEAFGYIPRTGDQKEVRLKRAVEDEEDRRENEEEGKGGGGPMARFKLTILGGNARKVGAVRFERLTEAVDDAVLSEERERRDRDKDGERERGVREKEREREMERARERAQQWEVAEREDKKRRESFRARGRRKREAEAEAVSSSERGGEEGGEEESLGLIWELESEGEGAFGNESEDEDLVGHFAPRGVGGGGAGEQEDVPGGSGRQEMEEEEIGRGVEEGRNLLSGLVPGEGEVVDPRSVEESSVHQWVEGTGTQAERRRQRRSKERAHVSEGGRSTTTE